MPANQVAQAVVHLRARSHELQVPEIHVDRPQLEGGRMPELPVARRPDVSVLVAVTGDVLVDEAGGNAEKVPLVPLAVERLIDGPAVPPRAMSSKLERTAAAVVDRAGRAQQDAPRARPAVEVQRRR